MWKRFTIERERRRKKRIHDSRGKIKKKGEKWNKAWGGKGMKDGERNENYIETNVRELQQGKNKGGKCGRKRKKMTKMKKG